MRETIGLLAIPKARSDPDDGKDYLLLIAQGYQESQLNQQAKSPVGAIGVMQVMPPTGKDMARRHQ